MMSTDVAVTGHYDAVLVVLSIFMAIGAFYAALDLATRVTSAHGKTRLLWLSGGAIAMGTGIRAMHYIGMLAYRLPIPVELGVENESDNQATFNFAVKDSGVGISEEKQVTIFEAFTQADTSITRKYGGTGLGLAISSRLVNMMGGRIWVESEIGKGSVFHFTLLLQTQKQSTRKYEPVEAQTLRDLRVLVVDDNSTYRQVLHEMVLGLEMKPTLAENGPEALTLLERAQRQGQPFALVILDAQIRGMDAFSAAKIVKNDTRLEKTVIIVLTSAGLRGDAAQCRELGISGYLT